MNLYNFFCVLTTLCSTRMTLSTTPRTIHEEETSNSVSLPVELALGLSNVTTFEELMNFVDEESRPKEILSARFGGLIERNAFRMAKFASCIPVPKTIPLKPKDADAHVLYHPPCTRVNRCDGCCSQEPYSCQPLEVEYLPIGVIITEYTGGNKLTYRRREVLSIEQHVSCKCDCKIKEADCQKYQEYNQNQCRCVCANYDEREKCYQQAPLKLWSDKDCICMCREIYDCSSGYYFDSINSCECIPERTRRYNTSDWDKFSYNVN